MIVFLELSLGLMAWISPGVRKLLASPYASVPPMLPDKTLGNRPNPDYPDHDNRGYRNVAEPVKADIVVLGDSQTYGTSVARGEAWPDELARITHDTTYNMAVPGYGPVHSLILWDEAVSMQPKVIIEAFYAGNDLYDSFSIVYNQGQHSELRSADTLLQRSVYEEETKEPIADAVARKFLMGARVKKAGNEGAGSEKPRVEPKRFWEYSRLYGLIRRAGYSAVQGGRQIKKNVEGEWTAARRFAEKHPAYCFPYSGERYKTILTPEYRLTVLDPRDARIEEGRRISFRAMKKMNDLAAAKNIEFFVLFIPTKEFVFCGIMKDTPVRLQALEKSESMLWKAAKDFCEENNIKYIDALPALREQLESGEQPYFVSHDGHPNKYGHIALARVVAARLSDRSMTRDAGSK